MSNSRRIDIKSKRLQRRRTLRRTSTKKLRLYKKMAPSIKRIEALLKTTAVQQRSTSKGMDTWLRQLSQQGTKQYGELFDLTRQLEVLRQQQNKNLNQILRWLEYSKKEKDQKEQQPELTSILSTIDKKLDILVASTTVPGNRRQMPQDEPENLSTTRAGPWMGRPTATSAWHPQARVPVFQPIRPRPNIQTAPSTSNGAQPAWQFQLEQAAARLLPMTRTIASTYPGGYEAIPVAPGGTRKPQKIRVKLGAEVEQQLITDRNNSVELWMKGIPADLKFALIIRNEWMDSSLVAHLRNQCERRRRELQQGELSPTYEGLPEKTITHILTPWPHFHEWMTRFNLWHTLAGLLSRGIKEPELTSDCYVMINHSTLFSNVWFHVHQTTNETRQFSRSCPGFAANAVNRCDCPGIKFDPSFPTRWMMARNLLPFDPAATEIRLITFWLIYLAYHVRYGHKKCPGVLGNRSTIWSNVEKCRCTESPKVDWPSIHNLFTPRLDKMGCVIEETK